LEFLPLSGGRYLRQAALALLNGFYLKHCNKLTTLDIYNHANLVTSLINNRNGALLSGYAYTYLLDGNQDRKIDHEWVQTTYAYDDLGRLTNETETAPAGARGQNMAQTVSKSYDFDAAGNRKTMTVSMTKGAATESYNVGYEYDGNNRLLTEKNKPSAPNATKIETAYLYDPNGNQISKLTNSLNPAGSNNPTVGIFMMGDFPGNSYSDLIGITTAGDGSNNNTNYVELRSYDLFNSPPTRRR